MVNMVETEIDPYPVSELTTQFGIGRTALYARMNSLTITPTKQGGKAFVSLRQLQRLDALNEHLKKGGALADFERVHRPDGESGEQADPVLSDATPSRLDRSEASGALGFLRMDVQSAAELVATLVVNPLVGGLKEALLTVFPAPLSRVERGLRLSHLRELEEAYYKGWLLSTSELADLLGLTATTVRSYGEQFEQAGFTFTRTPATRARGELAWKVGKMKLVEATNDLDTTNLD